MKKGIIIGIIVLVFIGLIKIANDMDEEYMEGCQENGYSYTYCLRHK